MCFVGFEDKSQIPWLYIFTPESNLTFIFNNSNKPAQTQNYLR